MSDFFLADDLSGALDAAAAFHHAGRRVRVVLTPDTWITGPRDEVVAVTTETRNAVPAAAAESVARAIAHARAQRARFVYKKIDSTLRGPVAAELSALAAALPEARILFAPGNPAVGRTVRGGVLYVRGVPVAETEFGRDPVNPVRVSEIRTLLGDVATERVVIADAESEKDLAAAVARMDAAGGEWVGVGSGALARPVAARFASQGGMQAEAKEAPLASGPALMVCGSAHPLNREQAAVLARERGVAAHELSVAAGVAVENAVADLRAGRGAAVLMEQRRGDSREVLRAIATAAAEIVSLADVRRVFVTGGETAFALCDALGVGALTFCAEIEAGLSVSRNEGAGGGVILFAIKPGGFGDERTWVRAWDGLSIA